MTGFAVLRKLFIPLALTLFLAACATPPVGGGTYTTSSGPGLTTPYAVTVKNFTTAEFLHLTNVMETEFPYYLSTRSQSGDTTKMVYGYVSQASTKDLWRWVNILLDTMGLDPDRQVKVVVSGTAFLIDKLY
jgi:hypothetical protein